MKRLKTFFTMLLILIMVSSISAQTSQQYTVDEIAQLQTDLTAGAYDEYILTTSGGVYDLSDSNINIGADAVIKAAEGLAEKPVISRTNNTTADAGIFRTQNVTINLVLEGLIFDGAVASEVANEKIIGLRTESTVHVEIDNCVFRNFTNINGVFRLQGAESSMDMRNSVFHDIAQRVIQPWQVDVTYGHMNIDNCHFYNINVAVIWHRSTGGGANLAIGSTLTVNHSTFHNINTNADGVFRGRDNNTGEVKILNSVFTNVAETRPITNAIKNLTVDYCHIGTTDVGSAANDPVITNLFTIAPAYEDAATFNFRITNADDFTAATGDVAGVVWYYAPRVHPDLLVENDNQVKLTFSRSADQATAEIATNYALSGTFGLTGNPSEAELVNDNEVLLTIGDISAMSFGETIAVTVTGVEDTYGLVVADENNVATFTNVDLPFNEYPVEDIERFQTDLAAGTYDEYILTTSGGVYDLTSQVTITSDAVIKAAEGLAEKPVIQRSSNDSGSQGIFNIQTNTVNIVLEGLILDGTFSTPGTASPIGFRADSPTHFTVNDCVFRNFDNSNGVFRLNVGGSSMDVRNSVFHDCKERVIHLYTPDEVYGDVNIDNCLFYNINGTVVFYRSSSGVTAIGTNLRVNHSTFHNIKIANTNDGVIRGRDNNTGETLILNSVFTEIEDNWPIIRGFVNNPEVDYCYFGTNSPHTGGDPIVTNTFTTAPVYEDAENRIFRITNADDFLVASGEIAGVTWYYAPRVNPDLLIENDTHLKVVFSRPVEVASAENTANYTLSGTFGLTGNPTTAELVNEREVLLTVGDLSAILPEETIIVTVTNVADTNGLVIDGNNVATFEEPMVIELEVFTENQTVTNAAGQSVMAQSSFGEGYVYIVLDGEPQQTKEQLDVAVASNKGEFTVVSGALVDIAIITFNLQPGTYFAYAVSTEGDLSAPSTNSIVITDGIAPIVANTAQTAGNGPDDFVIVQSNEDNGLVYIIKTGFTISTAADLDAAVAANQGSFAAVTAANTDIQISTAGIEAAVYFAYAVDAAGNLSDPGTEPITIEQFDTSTEDILADQVNVFSRSKIIHITAPLSFHGTGYEVYDINGRRVHTGTIDGSNQIETNAPGVHIIRFLNKSTLPIRVMVVK